jgi:putative ABC transport system permease protein
VNESFVKAANWKNPVGETINILGNSNETYHVIGVVKDYHFASLTKKITPQLFTMKGSYGAYYIKINPNTATTSLPWIQKTYRRFYPMSSYSYKFKNDENRQKYADVEKWKQLVLFGAILTIFISCIGLFGLQFYVLALVIASPLIYIAANKWLQNFPYRIQIRWWVFAFEGVLVMLVALFTISFQSINAAISNPVKSLRTEQ